MVNLSSVSLASPIVFLRHLFIDWIRHSKNPPYQGAFSRLNLHFTFKPDRRCCTSWLSNSCAVVCATDSKVFALSEITSRGIPLLAVNFLKHLRKVRAAKSGTNSRCTARVMQHVNKAIQTLLFCPSSCLM